MKLYRIPLIAAAILAISSSAFSAAPKSKTIDLPSGAPGKVVTTNDGQTILVTDTDYYGNNNVYFYDARNQVAAPPIPVMGRPGDYRFKVNPDNNEVMVSMILPSTDTVLYAISTVTHQVVKTFLGAAAGPMDYDKDKHEMHVMIKQVADNSWHDVSIDASNNITSDTKVSPLLPEGMVYDAHNKSMDIADVLKGINIVSTTTHTVIPLTVAQLSAGATGDDFMYYNEFDECVYVLNVYNAINVIFENSFVGNPIVCQITHTSNTQHLIGNPTNGDILVSLYDEGGYIFFIKNQAVDGPPLAVKDAYFFAYNADDGNMYCNGPLGKIVSVLSPDHQLVTTLSTAPNYSTYGMAYNVFNKTVHIAAEGPAPTFVGRDIAFKSLKN